MGIKNLFSIIKEEAPDAIKEGEIKNQFGRKVAIVSRIIAHVDFMPQANRKYRMRRNPDRKAHCSLGLSR